jgi:ABC-2 type transport system permease protein
MLYSSSPPRLVWLSHLLLSTPGILGFIKLNQMGATWAEVRPLFTNLLLLVFLHIGVAWWTATRRGSGPLAERTASA